MNRRMLVSTAFALATICASSTATYAAPRALSTPVHAMFSKTKLVSISLRNDSGAPLELKVGEDVMTLAVGKTVAMKLAVGTRIVSTQQTVNHAANSLIAQVSSDLSGATIAIK